MMMRAVSRPLLRFAVASAVAAVSVCAAVGPTRVDAAPAQGGVPKQDSGATASAPSSWSVIKKLRAQRTRPKFRRGAHARDLKDFRARYGRCTEIEPVPGMGDGLTADADATVNLEAGSVMGPGEQLPRALRDRASALRACVVDPEAAAIDGPIWHVQMDAGGPRLLEQSAPTALIEASWPCLRDALASLPLVVGARPTLRLAWPVTNPSASNLDAAAIRRTIRENIGDVSFCYEEFSNVLGRADRVQTSIRFLIDGVTGFVLAADVVKDTAFAASLGCCVAHAVSSWRFDATGRDSVVVVTYPFVMEAASP
jgi:hypothetical protein